MRPQVEVVLTNWKRKNNLPLIIDAMRNQNVPCTITLIDNAPDESNAVEPHVSDQVDKYFRISRHPYSSFLRYASHGFYEGDYLLIYDDDMIPGNECVSHFLNHANENPDYGVLGQFGRVVQSGVYSFRDIPQSKNRFTEVDICVCAYFVRSVPVMACIDQLKKIVISRKKDFLLQHDDMILAAACRLAKKKIALTPAGESIECHVKKQGLSQPFSLSDNSNWGKARTLAMKEINQIVMKYLSTNQ